MGPCGAYLNYGNAKCVSSQAKEKEMTTITYRDGKRLSSSESLSVAGYVDKLARAFRRWQTAREIESMPFDIRKDIGWPSADANAERKDM
jgi:hypothetical protein